MHVYLTVPDGAAVGIWAESKARGISPKRVVEERVWGAEGAEGDDPGPPPF